MTTTTAPALNTAFGGDADAYREALATISEAAAAYYQTGESLLDDDTYDALVRAAVEFETDYPDQAEPGSLIQQIAAGGGGAGDVEHTTAMLSLDNVYQ